jgi:hypothetical protein
MSLTQSTTPPKAKPKPKGRGKPKDNGVLTLPGVGGNAPGHQVDLGTGGIDWSQEVTTPQFDAAVIPIDDQSGDPLGLARLIPAVGPGHAPQSIAQRVASVSTMSHAAQQELAGILASAGIIAPKSAPYTPTQVQAGLTEALKQASQNKSPSLSAYLQLRGTATAASGEAQTDALTAGITDNLTKIATSYEVPISSAAIAQHVKSYVDAGLDSTQADASFTEYAKGLAAGLYPSLAPQIQAGVSTSTLLDPYKLLAEHTVGIDPDTIDWTRPMWGAALNGTVDPKTGRASPMTLSQWSQKLMSDPQYGYQNTMEAQNAAGSLTDSLLQLFGKLPSESLSTSLSGPAPDLSAT